MGSDSKQELFEYLSGFVTENKLALFEKVIRFRTRYITVVLENIYQPHNASAVLRTCDCFGIQDVHIVENENRYEVNPDVALGSSKWLTLKKYLSEDNNTQNPIEHLKTNGYRIIATSPHKNDVLLEELSLETKIALVFGTEMRGLTDDMMARADGWVKVPMVGFTESLNVSVSAAVILHCLTEKLRQSAFNWRLSDEEIWDIKLEWIRSVIKRPELIEQKFHKK